MVFVNSMSDLFHEDVPTAYIKAVCRVMSASPWNIYQVLTKRSQRMKKLLESDLRSAAEQEHIWWGVSVEDRRYGMPRIEDIRKAPARIRFLSIEPLLADLGELDLTGIKWVIVGGESGAGARPMNESWVISIMEQCQCKDIPFFFKQWGGVRKKQTGRQLLGRTYDDFPQVARSAFPNKSERLHLLTSLTKEFLAVLGNNNSEQLELPIAIETIE
jgi:protein gp37